MASPQAVRVSFEISGITVELDQGGTVTRPLHQHEAPLITPLCLVLGLTPVESRALTALMEHQHISRGALHAAMSRDGIPTSKLKTVDVTVCKLRKKLNGHGIGVVTDHGLGFRLAEGANDKIRKLLDQYNAGLLSARPKPEDPEFRHKTCRLCLLNKAQTNAKA